ncbi:transcriptional regulator FtrA [Niveibacterium umoris]|uniref:AraC family transcriptional activator FtrA n=1 Tax=Niveibacterium umoris TaxID=1193620 RepID=A0A840BRQ5_9RHOO|nr:helix-turn-helix domain-containing protein [Niveibacterium umoris]MBB4013496.1 AraC family transcriptional activator FtrA [Niveibacterium umoris]
MNTAPHVLAVLHPRVALFELGIAAELFGLARPELGVPWYQFDTLLTGDGPAQAAGALRLASDTGLDALDRADLIVVPGWSTDPEPPPAALLAALQRADARGARFMSICSGAFLLGHAGLLDGRRATTHWRHCERFAALFPQVRLDPDVLYVEEGRILTAAGSAAGIDAGLHLIAQDYGSAIANRVAQRMLVTPHRDGGQRQFIPAAYPQRRSERFDAVLAWAEAHLAEPLSVARLAERAAMSERSFLRRFHGATALTPMAWLSQLRIGRARAMLESGDATLDDIASACGYGSAESLRAAFRREVGLSPAAYRQRFRMRALQA